ncbi:phosphoribosyltransferase-like protein [Aureibacter tunicatorum]|uniref:Phosphoribosyltransferase domain-containing protein n=1 Tax=Aureibacter tunicatorum TaxID=866807 RepID=A0AAE4BTX2_9BACT|nr:uracil phosphoribosyltransferase [Aureibacter tunicatorum]MDR6241181.1 hypothetical protein [Aureibacter tunicatorum]BDD03956.1 hypothetical protein AUTU_14390 [Aureibacter tunicatorum]
MKYPSKIQQQLEDVKSIISSWSINVDFEQVLQWIMQFDNQDFGLAIRILKNLNVIGYDELNEGLEVAYSKLERKAIEAKTKISHKNTIFAGIGENGKSGNMISYNFRLTNEISEDNFVLNDETLEYLEAGQIKNIVLIDDILSTGDSVLSEVKKLTEKTIPLKVENIFVLTAVGMSEGIEKVKEETKGKVHVFSAFEYDISDTVISLDSKFYDGIPYQDRIKVKEKLEYYGNSIYQKGKLGYKGIGGLIVFYYNTPNTTIPLIWGSRNSWIPLFKRATKLTGISAHYKEFDKAIAKKAKAQQTTEKNLEEITFYVEGRFDEEFLVSQLDKLISFLELKKASIISLGGFNSKKLIDNLNKLSNTKLLFVAEDDTFAPSGYQKIIKDNIKNSPHIFIQPVMYYIKIDQLYADEDYIRLLPKEEELVDLNDAEKRRLIERKFLRRMSMMRNERLKLLFERHVDESKIELLFKEIKDKLKE